MENEALSQEVIGAAIEVHRMMGPGLLESVYQVCLVQELRLRKVEFTPQYRVPLIYKGTPLEHDLVIEFFFANRLVVELKAVERVLSVHEAQLLTYMKLTSVKVGLLINFNVPILKNGLKRMVL